MELVPFLNYDVLTLIIEFMIKYRRRSRFLHGSVAEPVTFKPHSRYVNNERDLVLHLCRWRLVSKMMRTIASAYIRRLLCLYTMTRIEPTVIVATFPNVYQLALPHASEIPVRRSPVWMQYFDFLIQAYVAKRGEQPFYVLVRDKRQPDYQYNLHGAFLHTMSTSLRPKDPTLRVHPRAYFDPAPTCDAWNHPIPNPFRILEILLLGIDLVVPRLTGLRLDHVAVGSLRSRRIDISLHDLGSFAAQPVGTWFEEPICAQALLKLCDPALWVNKQLPVFHLRCCRAAVCTAGALDIPTLRGLNRLLALVSPENVRIMYDPTSERDAAVKTHPRYRDAPLEWISRGPMTKVDITKHFFPACGDE